MKTKKLKLADLNVKSFSTTEGKLVKGGTTVYYFTDYDMCYDDGPQTLNTCNGDCDGEDPTYP